MAVAAPKNWGRRPTEDIAAEVARTWKSCPGNHMQLKNVLQQADKDGDGTIDKDEFKDLIATAGGAAMSEAEAQKLFAQFDQDGDGELTALEIQQMQEKKRAKASMKARNNI